MSKRDKQRSDNLKKWHLINAEGLTLGRIATQASILLRGKQKVDFKYHLDSGDHVIVINADKLNLSGNKINTKKYYSHSGFLGNLKIRSFAEIRPVLALEKAIYGMLPVNSLRRIWLKRLHIYRDQNHPHQANIAEHLKDNVKNGRQT